jgi:vanillate O-demethylase monooxygenase subunit
VYLRNEWYVAALSDELEGRPVARTLLGQPLVLFRTASGKAAVMDNRCPHRGAPLSTGEVVGESLVCGYHGFSFETTGRCNHIPGGAVIPAKACVRSYPVVDRWGWVFVWMGDLAHVDESLLPNFRWTAEPGWAGGRDYLHVRSNYTLVRDNLLDLTHARFVHKNTLATSAVTDTPIRTSLHGRVVRVERNMLNIEPSPFFKKIPGFKGRVDHRQCIEFHAASYISINTTVTAVAGEDDDRTAAFYVLNAMTPETDKSTHYFWALVRNFAPEDDEVTRMQHELNRATFQEDVDILEQQQALLDSAPADWQPVAVPNDGGCIQAARLMKRLLAQEAGSTA